MCSSDEFKDGVEGSVVATKSEEFRGRGGVSVPTVLDTWGARAAFAALPSRRDGTASVARPPSPVPHTVEQSLEDAFGSAPGEGLRLRGRLAGLVLAPESHKRMCWDMLSMLLLVYDVMHTPLMVFLDPVSPFENSMAVLTTVFWTLDIGVSFLRGFYRSCVLELRPEVIARHYLTREFVPDMLIVGLDWTTMAIDAEAAGAVSYSRLTKVIRFIRIARILRLVRLVKVPGLVEILENSVTDFATLSLIHVAKCMVLIMGANHFIACGWYYIGGVSSPSWRDSISEEGRSVTYRYFTALHWSITQFTAASMEVQPRNIYERVFAICTIVVGLMMFSSFVSTITSTMTTLRVERAKRSKQRDCVRRYLAEHGISLALSSRIAHFLSGYRFDTKRRVARSDITLFKALPKNLQLMLDWEAYQAALISHGFFLRFSQCSPPAMLQICHVGVEEVSTAPCEELFHCGQRALAMHITLAGSMRYFQGFDELRPREVHRGLTALSEPALWLQWVHQGRIFAVTACDFVRVSAASVSKALEDYPQLVAACHEYARLYCSTLEAILLECPLEPQAGTGQGPAGSVAVAYRPMIDDLFTLNADSVQEMAQSAFSAPGIGGEPSARNWQRVEI